MATSTQQFGRVAQVVIGKTTVVDGTPVGKGFEVDSLRIRFDVTKTIRPTPNPAKIEIFNLSPANEGNVRNEYDEVFLNAGYKGNQRLVFTGNIRHAFRRRDGNNWITTIDAADGDNDLRNTIVNAVFQPTVTNSDVIKHIVAKFKTTKMGAITVKDVQRVRPRVVSKMARDVFHEIAKYSDAHWSIQNGQLQFVPVDGTLDTEAIELRSDTGLLESPEITDKGIKFKCQLNPELKIHGKVKLNNNDLREAIRQARASAPGAKVPKKKKAEKPLAHLDPDGIYRISWLRFVGDNRGPEWFTEGLVTALGTPIAPGRVVTP